MTLKSSRLILTMVAVGNAFVNGPGARGQQDNLFSSVRTSVVFADTTVQSEPRTPPVETTTEGKSPPAANSDSSTPDVSDVSIEMLHGRWAARRSATEAFAVLLNTDATFVLVSVINGRQSRSTGKFSLQNNQLTLQDSDGVRMVGSVTVMSASEFQFTPQTAGNSGTSLSFRKAP